MPIWARVDDCLTTTAAILPLWGCVWSGGVLLYLAATFVPWMLGFNFDPSECIPQVLSFADVSQFTHDPSEVIPPDLLVGEAILIAIRPRLFRLNGGGRKSINPVSA
ncbi:MAG: hypothetical protein ACRDCT_01280 [Shewanella sp.]